MQLRLIALFLAVLFLWRVILLWGVVLLWRVILLRWEVVLLWRVILLGWHVVLLGWHVVLLGRLILLPTRVGLDPALFLFVLLVLVVTAADHCEHESGGCNQREQLLHRCTILSMRDTKWSVWLPPAPVGGRHIGDDT